MKDVNVISRSIPSTPRSGNYPKGSTVINNGGSSVTYMGDTIDIIKQLDSTQPSDTNTFSALRTIKEITARSISKTADDTAEGHITFNNGITTKGVSTIDEADITTLKADSAEIEGNLTVKGTSAFQGAMTGLSMELSGLMKAAAATVVGLMTVGSLSANSGTIDNFNSDIIAVSTKVTSPLFVGALQGNADTATKLQTARSIFNIPFDGSADCNGNAQITGTLDVNGVINAGGNQITNLHTVWCGWGDLNHVLYYGYSGKNYVTWQEYGGLWYFCSGESSTEGDSNIIAQLGNTNYFQGSMGIGITSPSYKLQVAGDIGAYTAHFSNLSNGYLPYNTSSGLANSPIQTDGSKVGVKTTPTYDLDVAGTFRATADMFADGNIGTRNYVSQTTGWRVDNVGNSEFRKIYADELDVQAFTAQVSQALAGSDYLTKSVSKLSYNFVIPASVGSTARLIVDDLEGFPSIQCFTNGDYIRLRPINKTNGLIVGNAYGTVVLDMTYGTNGFFNGTQAYTFTATSISNGAGLTVFKGSEVLDYGTSGNGLIKRTVLDAAGSPYMDIATWSSDPSNSANYTTHVRLGNLAGVTNCSGYGLYSDNVFLTKSIIIGDLTKTGNYLSFDTTNGLQIKLGGTSVATTSDVSSSASSTLSVANTNAQGYATTAQANAANDATDKANNAVASANGYTNTQISIVNGNITSAISSVQIGGVNLIEGTQDLSGLSKYGTLSQDDYLGFTSVSNNAPDSGYIDMLARNNISGLKLNQLYTLSFYAKSTVNGDAILSYFYPGLNGAGADGETLTTLTTEWKRYSITWNRLGNDAVNVLVARLYNGRLTGTVSICGVKFEEGNKATSWSPAPQDVTNAISTAQSAAIAQAGNNAAALYVTQTNYNSYVSQTDQAISARVTTTTFNALGDRVSTAESNISANANAITQKVSTTDYTGNTIASLINQSATTVKIQASQINLIGAVTFSSFDSSTQGVINAKADTSTVNTQVSNAITTVATDATNKVNAVQIGGRNLIAGSSLSEFTASYPSGYQDYQYYLSTEILKGTQYVMSFWAKSTVSNDNIRCYFFDPNTTTHGLSSQGTSYSSTDGEMNITLSTTWTHYWIAYTTDGTDSSLKHCIFMRLYNGAGSGTISMKGCKLESGTKATDWSPAPEDVNSNISNTQQAAQNYATTNCVQVGLSNAPDAIKNQVLAAAHGNFSYIDGSSIYTGTLNANQVTAGYISSDRIAASSITAGKIDTNSLTSDTAFINYVQTKIVTSTYINTLSLSANAIVSGTINTNLLDAATIKSNIVNAAYISSLSITTGTLTVTGGSMLGALSVTTDGSLVNGSAFSLSSAGKLTCNNVDLTGKITATSGTFAGTLNGVSGTFNTLTCNGSLICKDTSGNTLFQLGTSNFYIQAIDMQHQGVYNNRSLRFLSNNIRCRGSFGHKSMNFMVLYNSVVYYYVNGNDYYDNSISDFIQGTATTSSYNGHTYYNIYLYPDSSSLNNITEHGHAVTADLNGFPVDVIIIESDNAAYYRLIGSPQKEVTIINANDGNNSIYFASCENAAHPLQGGNVMDLINVYPSFMSGSRTLNSIDKSCWMIRSAYNNDFN